MRLKNVSFATWLKSHAHKEVEERWLRELYPWPVLARVDCDDRLIGQPQEISHDGVDYIATLKSAKWQPARGTFKYRLLIESLGLGWHSRPFADEFDICGAPDGTFVTLFHSKNEEPLEKIARAFFAGRWDDVSRYAFKSLAVSRFLTASLVGMVAEEAFHGQMLEHYPQSRLLNDAAPLLADGDRLWLGHRFYSEDAYAWARRSAAVATRVVAIYFADTKYQFRTDLPVGAAVLSVAEIDSVSLAGKYAEPIRALLRGLEVPAASEDLPELTSIVLGKVSAPASTLTEADVHESLAAIKCLCDSKAELRYQLAAGVLLNTWIENERRLGFVGRKHFYAFKQRIREIVGWAVGAQLPGITIWRDQAGPNGEVLYVRIDNVDFSFHAIPDLDGVVDRHPKSLTWNGVRLKLIAPIVLAWARELRKGSLIPGIG